MSKTKFKNWQYCYQRIILTERNDKMNTIEKFEKDIEFFDREDEKHEIMSILRVKPQRINFIYGPINSGKTTLITNLIEELPENYVVFYINLRRKSIIKYGDFIRVLFAIEEKGFLKKIKNIFTKVLKHVASTGEKEEYKFTEIPVDRGLLETFFKEKSNEDVFNYLVEYFKNIAKHKTPVLVIDELQVIGDLEIDGKLIYKLFNFFIGLTKELHICHVFTLSYDSLFIERVYNEAMLEGRANYILVDDFDEETAKKFLEKYKIGKEEQELAWNNFGGKPSLLGKFIFAANKNECIADEILFRKGQIETTLNKVRELNIKITVDEDKLKVDYENLIKVLKKFEKSETISVKECDEISKAFFVNRNILFVDLKKNIIKSQSIVDLLAIREILKEI